MKKLMILNKNESMSEVPVLLIDQISSFQINFMDFDQKCFLCEEPKFMWKTLKLIRKLAVNFNETIFNAHR